MPSHGNEVKFDFLEGKTHSCLRLKREQLFCHKIKSAILGHHKQKKKKYPARNIAFALSDIRVGFPHAENFPRSPAHTTVFSYPSIFNKLFVPGLSLFLIRAELRRYSWQGFASTNGKISIKGISGKGTEDRGADDNAEDGCSLLSSGSVCPDGAATHKMSRVH